MVNDGRRSRRQVVRPGVPHVGFEVQQSLGDGTRRPAPAKRRSVARRRTQLCRLGRSPTRGTIAMRTWRTLTRHARLT
jgi:hypothetical protein